MFLHNLDELNFRHDADPRELERTKRELECETNDLRRVESERLLYLTESVKHYLSALQVGNFDKTVPHRVASLLMRNKSEPFLNDIISVCCVCFLMLNDI